ncbi:MAG: hypothetical protein Q9225_006499 [Loekoesia sp. 1 TL-2023]
MGFIHNHNTRASKLLFERAASPQQKKWTDIMPALWDRILQEGDASNEIRRLIRLRHLPLDERSDRVKMRKEKAKTKWAQKESLRVMSEELVGAELERQSIEGKRLARLEERKKSLARFEIPDSPSSALFHARLAVVWKGLTSLSKSNTWTTILGTLPPRVWHAILARYTWPHVQEFLVSDRTPTIFTLEPLSNPEYLKDTIGPYDDVAGIYAWILRPRRKTKFLGDDCYVHIGSRSGYHYGLYKGVSGLKNMLPDAWARFPGPEIKKYHLDSPGIFIPLFRIPFNENTREEARRVGALVKVAEAVFTIWLGAVRAAYKPTISDFIPWGGRNIRYQGFHDLEFLSSDFELEGRS